MLAQTELDDVPTALLAFQGRLVAACGRALRIFDIGKRKLLRKAENKVCFSISTDHSKLICVPQSFPVGIITLNTQGSRIIVGDQQDSVFYAVYKAPENRLLVFADDTQPRWTTCTTMVDYDTIAGGDKFGNVFINRLATNISEDVDNDPTGAGILHEKGFLMGAPHKTEMLAHFHVSLDTVLFVAS